jgi:hypothetical protein
LTDIAEKKALDDPIKSNIKAALDAFKERFSAAIEAGAQPATA